MSTVEADLRGPYVGSMMRTTVNWIMDCIYDHVVAAGFDDLGRAHVGCSGIPLPKAFVRPSSPTASRSASSRSTTSSVTSRRGIPGA